MTDALHREEFLAGYVAEAHEHLETARRAVLAVEELVRRGQPAPRPARELFRSLHTLKGLSGMIGAEPVVDIAHEMEAIVRAADRAGGRLRAQAIEWLLRGLAAIEERVERLARGEPVPAAARELLDALAALEAPEQRSSPPLELPPELGPRLDAAEREQLAAGVAEGRRAVRIDFTPSPERAARGVDITAVRQRVERLAEIVKVVPRSSAQGEGSPAGLVFVLLVLTSAASTDLAAAADAPLEAVRDIPVRATEPPEPAAPAGEAFLEPSPATSAFVRVEVTRLDEALEHVSALTVSRARLARRVEALAASGVDLRPLGPILQDHARELRRLRAAVMRARLVRIADVLERALLVRGLAQNERKQVRLLMEVGQAEVDKSVGERLFPALVHLLRNAVDHAIERPAERRAAGKAEEGTIRIAALRRGEGELELTVSDDGRGIDVAAVARKAGAPIPSTSAEILDLIGRPGLSTLSTPTRTSGRGIGMDVVRRIIGELGGTLAVSTSPSAGTTFTLRVPVTLAIVDGLTLECAGERYVVPTAAVDELVEVDPRTLVPSPAPRGAGAPVRLLRWRSEAIPFFELREVLDLPDPGAGPAGRKGIIVRRDAGAVGFGVDRMLGRQEVVIRSLADPLVERAGIAGATDLGDGRPTLVLDLGALARTLPTAPPPAAEAR